MASASMPILIGFLPPLALDLRVWVNWEKELNKFWRSSFLSTLTLSASSTRDAKWAICLCSSWKAKNLCDCTYLHNYFNIHVCPSPPVLPSPLTCSRLKSGDGINISTNPKANEVIHSAVMIILLALKFANILSTLFHDFLFCFDGVF